MAETVKLSAGQVQARMANDGSAGQLMGYKAPAPPKVLHLALRDSVELSPAPPQTTLQARRGDNRPNMGQTPDLEMELDRGLGGVVIRYRFREEARTYLIPMANIRALRLE